ncbi:MAG TPA: Uma2 family endonuclease [Verrucomicrobiales bacterium]|jgi:Uma2 family endonuclease|nr:Uma2 family endonuclease [Verrucomicrobiales bacterium]
MLATPRSRSRKPTVWLENGYRLTTAEFLRRWEALPQIKRAELIEGIVYMPPPLRADSHAEPDALMHLWLGYYASQTAGVKLYANPTLILDRENTPQPDSVLCRIPSKGGRSFVNKEGYLTGPPELICEVSSSSAALDMNAKFAVYRRSGVQEYLVWLTGEKRVSWFVLEGGEYVPLIERAGLLKSRTFAGLVLDVKALLAMNGARVLAVQQRILKKPV